MSQRIPKLVGLLLAGAILMSASTGFADGNGTVASGEEQLNLFSLTISPIHLLMPVVELTAEFRADPDWGVAAVGGFGNVTAEHPIIGDQSYDVWEAGGQLRWYALGDFDHGMQVGAEVLYAHVSNDAIETPQGSISAVGEGVSVGPFLGYKIATDIGFTFDGQLGVQRVGVGAEASSNTSGDTESDESSDWGPLLNLNVGWSF